MILDGSFHSRFTWCKIKSTGAKKITIKWQNGTCVSHMHWFVTFLFLKDDLKSGFLDSVEAFRFSQSGWKGRGKEIHVSEGARVQLKGMKDDGLRKRVMDICIYIYTVLSYMILCTYIYIYVIMIWACIYISIIIYSLYTLYLCYHTPELFFFSAIDAHHVDAHSTAWGDDKKW